MEINGDHPKEIDYIIKLYFNFQRENLGKRLLRKVTGENKKGYTKKEFAEFLSHKNDDYAYQFLDKLEEANVITQVGKRQNGSGQTPIWRLNKPKLLTAFKQTEYYQQQEELFFKALNREGDIL